MKKIPSVLFAIILILVSAPAALAQVNPQPVITQNSISGTAASNTLCVRVGNPATEKPSICNLTISSGTTGISGGASLPAPEVLPSQLNQTIKDQFGVSFDSNFSEQSRKWVYDAFWKWQQTNPGFMELIRGQRVIWIPDASGANALKNIAEVGDKYSDGQKFLGTLTHEMSHVIYWTKDPGPSRKFDVNGVFANQGAVTSYGKSGGVTENYPETISNCLTQRPVGALSSQVLWDNYYKPLAESITGGPCL